jgi:hypothetical protein
MPSVLIAAPGAGARSPVIDRCHQISRACAREAPGRARQSRKPSGTQPTDWWPRASTLPEKPNGGDEGGEQAPCGASEGPGRPIAGPMDARCSPNSGVSAPCPLSREGETDALGGRQLDRPGCTYANARAAAAWTRCRCSSAARANRTRQHCSFRRRKQEYAGLLAMRSRLGWDRRWKAAIGRGRLCRGVSGVRTRARMGVPATRPAIPRV